MKNIFLLGAGALLLSACGPKTLGNPSKKPADDKGLNCPASLKLPEEEVLIYLKNSTPARLGVTVEGKEKYSECKTMRDAPSIVRLERLPGNRVLIKVKRMDKSRIEEISLGVKDLKDCVEAPEDFIKEERTAVIYKTEYPDGPKCPGQETARMEIVR
ncbi:MAG: hypothetical protein AB7K68_01585 [Bacteriovoracia bacterium]